MSTTTIAVDRNKVQERVVKPKTVRGSEEAVKVSSFKFFIRSIYYEILDTAKSVLIIFSVFALCKYSGLFSWWIQLIGNM